MSELKQFLIKSLDVPLCFIRKAWRPLTCVWISGCVFVNGVYLPYVKGEPADMVALAGLITAVTAAFAVREWGKMKGTAE